MIRVKDKNEKAGLKFNIQKTKISHPVPSLHGKDRETMETVRNFIFLGSKITVDSDCSHEIKRCLLLGRKAMIHLDSVLKSRNITLLTKVMRKEARHMQRWDQASGVPLEILEHLPP